MENPVTNRHSLKVLAKLMLSKFESQKMIEFNPKARGDLQGALETYLSGKILTDEDLTNQVRTQVSAAAGAIADQNLTETDAFKSQKRALRARYEDNMIQGFYLKDTLRSTSQSVVKFLFDNPLVEDVFESDDVLSNVVMTTLQTFDESKIAG